MEKTIMLYMAEFTEQEIAFMAAVSCLVKKNWHRQYWKFAEEVGISGGYLSEIISFKKCPQPDKQERIFKKLNFSTLEDCLEFGRRVTPSDLSAKIPTPTMQATATNTPPPEPAPIADISQKHHGIIDQFEDKERATRINEMLVEIEKIDDDELEEIKDLIAAKLKKLLRKSGGLKKTGTDGLPG
jgi:hypothetical protein